MATISKPYTFSAGATIVAAEHNSNFDVLYADYNGNITNANISASANIAYSKLTLTGSVTASDIATGFGIVPSGGIIMWSGAADAIPSGWYLCNGSNSTPDLRGKFVIGAGGTYAVAATGGATTKDLSHTHTLTDSSTGISWGAPEQGTGAAARLTELNGTTANSGGSATQDIMPPYYALCYIMKA